MSDSFKLSLSQEHLAGFFSLESIRDGKSLKYLSSINGVQGLSDCLESSLAKGIDSDSLTSRAEKFGRNQGYFRDRKGIVSIIWEALQDTVLQILILASMVSLIIGTMQDRSQGWIEGSVILLAVLIVLTVTATNDYIKDGQFLKLNKATQIHHVTVTRDGKEQEIPASQLLVGDLMHVSPGEVLNVDGILVKSTKLKVDESQITGESSTVSKESAKGNDLQCDPFLLSGSKIIEGYGLMIVCGVGMNSINEKIRQMSGVDNEEEETPLQERLGNLALALGKVGLYAGIVLTGTLLLYTAVDAVGAGEWRRHNSADAISALIIGITVLVVAIPEGLPLALTLSMAYSVIQMKKENIFVRHIKGCEIMGAATNILTDKTGTLTENKMKVCCGKVFGAEFAKTEELELDVDKRHLLSKVIARNSTAFFKVVDGKQEISGSRTEGAMIDLVQLLGEDIYKYRDPEQEILRFPFTSETKRMTTVYNCYNKGFEVYTKGAAEVMVDLCHYYLNSCGQVAVLDSVVRDEFMGLISFYTSQRLRVLGLAYRSSDCLGRVDMELEELENGLVLIGLVAMQDKLRPEAEISVQGVQRAGIVVRMVTGDNIETARAIAKKLSILPNDKEGMDSLEESSCVMTGKDFREKSGGLIQIRDSQGAITEFKLANPEQFALVTRSLRVIARCTPEDKLLLTIGLKELGEVVAVTGDGSNDAAALKQSDIGIAMMSGTQLAKESSDIILLDDNFASVLNSVKWGRNVYSSTRKFLQFQMTVNIVALFMSILGGITVSDAPINAVQMLWVNLIMDSLAALALATEPPSDGLLETVPFGRTENIITYDMMVIIASQCLFQCLILIIILYLGPQLFNIEESWGHDHWSQSNGKHFTIFFHCFVMLQLFNEINCRKASLSQVNVFKDFFNNWMFQLIFISTFVVQMLLIHFGGQYLKCARLNLQEHLICIGIGIIGLGFGILVRASFSAYRFKDFYRANKREEYKDDGEENEKQGLMDGEN